MPQLQQPTLTPFDTGARCEPKVWHPDRASAISAMTDNESESIGNVDFDDDEAHTVATVRLSRNDDGTHTVHVFPFVDSDEITVEVHAEPIV